MTFKELFGKILFVFIGGIAVFGFTAWQGYGVGYEWLTEGMKDIPGYYKLLGLFIAFIFGSIAVAIYEVAISLAVLILYRRSRNAVNNNVDEALSKLRKKQIGNKRDPFNRF
jgi:uncharacterized membrane protein